MEQENIIKKKKKFKEKYSDSGSGVYFLGLVGSAVYFIGGAATFGAGFVGFLKALVWPAYLIYNLFKFLGV